MDISQNFDRQQIASDCILNSRHDGRPDLWIRFHDFILDTAGVGPTNESTTAAFKLWIGLRA